MPSLAEIESEIGQRFTAAQAIQNKYENGVITDPDARDEVQKLFGEITDLERAREERKGADGMRERIERGLDLYRRPGRNGDGGHTMQIFGEGGLDEKDWKSIGRILTDDEEYVRLLQSGVFDSPNNIVNFSVDLGRKASMMDRIKNPRSSKALVYSGSGVGGAFVTPDYQPGVVALLQRPLTVLDVVPTTPTTSNVISYVREDTFTNAAAMVPEATASTGTSGSKPESAIAFSRQTAPIRTAATWIPVTNNMLADAPAMRGVIDQRLMVMLEQTIENQILAGNGTGENMTGVLNAGIQTRGRGTDTQQDAIYKAAVQVAVTGQSPPENVIMHPLDWQTIRLAREGTGTGFIGGYLMGPPALAGADTLWGYRVILSQAMPVGTALVASWRLGGMYFEREGAVLRAGLINDQFIRNMQTLLVEARGNWVTFRPNSFCQVTGL